ncbi:FAD:protein FMN transferase [Sabulilitoribacter arenilitoris]|uniref:FAD:protein FMN transferase n=1 Tax=Wocania arenilitoris TaxID=2044858 RepID=A0AAE3ENS5_9FLAO|nr:FAD:protein FMN transferase [Wocania arenilitoris]MCF7568835.1 FAD:protein FMN transferase [Wocania arenilitoris]
MKKRILFVLTVLLIVSCKKEKEVNTNTILEGVVFGTDYKVVYNSEINYQKQFDSLFYIINKSMSTYQVNSDISKLNRNESVEVDEHFIKVLNNSKEIYKATKGAFDPTIGAVVNAWDFGSEGKIINLDSLKIDSLMVSVGLDKVKLINRQIVKPKETFIDFNAIAKGYAVDVVSEFLENQNAKNYLVYIGGEIRTSGINIEKKLPWRVGVENPNFNGTQSINRALSLKDKAMATSGTYRKFKVDENGNRYAHIIDTQTGYPSKTNLLSISVIADDCMTADAYATAFKAMGIEKVKAFLKEHPELKVFLIFENENQEFETLALNDFPE